MPGPRVERGEPEPATQQTEGRWFSLTRGGPSYRLAVAARLVRGDRWDCLRLSAAVCAAGWVPLLVIALIEWVAAHRLSGVLRTFSPHVRMLVAVPLFFIAERSLDWRTADFTRRLSEWQLVRGADLPELERLFARAARARDSTAAEVVLLALAVGVSQIDLWGPGAALGVISPYALGGRPSGAWLWYGLVTLPIFQFLLFRWARRWWLWSRLLWGISRLDLRLVPTHPDRAGGLGTVEETAAGFVWVFLGISAVLAALWSRRVAFEGASARAFVLPFAGFAALVLAATLGPPLIFARRLWRVRLRGRWDYGQFALRYARRFHDRWIEAAGDTELLGVPDIQSLSDLINSYEALERTRIAPVSLSLVIVALVAIAIPMIPLLLAEVPLSEILGRLLGIIVGAR